MALQVVGGRSQNDAVVQLSPLQDTKEELRASFRRRSSEFDFERCHPADLESRLAVGWSEHRKTGTGLWIKRRKPSDRQLEDDLWCLFFKMGYPVLGAKGFRINYERHDSSKGSKQIDVFAKDNETVIIAECKCREVMGRRQLSKDLHELESLKGVFASAIKHHFGSAFRPKIIWMFVTKNIIWNEKDIEKAEAANIQIVTENELRYFETFIGHIGSAGRYQFLAELLKDQNIPGLSNVRVPAVRGSFGKGINFFSFVVSARHLLKIAFVNHQALNHPEGKPAYQRMIKKARIKHIGDFICGGGFFPTNILLNFVEKPKFEALPKDYNQDKASQFGFLYLPSKYKSAWVIDGQHRLYGFSNLDDEFLDRKLFVLAFEQLEARKEAEMFITINSEQKSVPPGLLVTLQADLKLGSDDPKEATSALASGLVRALNSDNSSPLYSRFSTPDMPPTALGNLTVAEGVKGLTRSALIGRPISRKARASGPLSAATDQDTIKRARKILNGYFQALMDANPERWIAGRSAYVCVNPGIRAHLQLVADILVYLEAKHVIDPQLDSHDIIVGALVDFISPITEFIHSGTEIQIEQKFSRKFGEGGVLQYLYNLVDLVVVAHPDFGSEEYKKYKENIADTRTSQAGRDLEDIQNAVAKICIETLKKVHGTKELASGEKAYWDIGIENADVKQKAYTKQQADPPNKRSPREAYIDFIDYIKIVKQPNNWPHLEQIMNIPLPGEKGKKYYLEWVEKINDLRRISAYKSPYRTFCDEDFELIDHVKSILFKNTAQVGIEI